MELKLKARRLNSSRPSASMRSDRSRVAATFSLASVSRRTGASAALETSEAERDRDPDAERGDQDQEERHAVERVIDVRQRLRDLDRVVASGRVLGGGGEHSNVRLADLRVAEERPLAALRCLERPASDRERLRLLERPQGGSVGADDLDVAAGPEDVALDLDVAPPVRCLFYANGLRPRRDLLRACSQPVVDLVVERVLDDEPDDRRRGDDGQRDGGCGHEGEACAKTHLSRRAYPTPRTVWMSRGSSLASVLRRR